MQVQATQSTAFGLATAVPACSPRRQLLASPQSSPISYALPQGHFHKVSLPEFVVRRATWAAPGMPLFTSNTLQLPPVSPTSQAPQPLAR